MTAAHDVRRPPISVAVLDLLERGRATLEAACRTSDASERYRDSHLGALRAAAWAVGKPPGRYDMLDVLGLGDSHARVPP